MIRCIATDMDGTLLNSSAKKITDENKEAILAAQSQGIEVVITTGRSYEEVVDILEEARIQCPVIDLNGAETRSKNGEIISVTPLNKEEAESANEKMKEHNIFFEVFTDKGRFTYSREKSMSTILDFIKKVNPNANMDQAVDYVQGRVQTFHEVNDYRELFANPEFKIYKLLAFSFEAESLKRASQALKKIENIVVSSSGEDNLEINHKLAQKGIALERFVAEREIPLSQTMALGDNFNDVSMFERVGRAVAMGNATDEIKAKCHFVTATNDESGVAKAIWDVLKG